MTIESSLLGRVALLCAVCRLAAGWSDPCASPRCAQLAACVNCAWPTRCDYGERVQLQCTLAPACGLQRDSSGAHVTVTREAECLYCWQTDVQTHRCTPVAHRCRVRTGAKVLTNCTVPDDVLCMGTRTFGKRVPCDWTSGYKWSTAFALSVTLGGFGADRFYLGQWKSGLGKLFSFGGLGLWTLVDVLLVAVGYLMPADGSSFVY